MKCVLSLFLIFSPLLCFSSGSNSFKFGCENSVMGTLGSSCINVLDTMEIGSSYHSNSVLGDIETLKVVEESYTDSQNHTQMEEQLTMIVQKLDELNSKMATVMENQRHIESQILSNRNQ